MDILVVAATEMEIAPFLNRQTGVVHLITGVGVPVCMYQLQKQLHLKKYDFVIQAGIAGTFTNKTKHGSCVIVEKDVFADVGVREQGQFSSLFEMGFAGSNDVPYNDGWILNSHPFLDVSPLEKVSSITVNTVTDDVKVNKINQEKYKAAIESMEGAALHYVCAMENIPYLQIRSISNSVGERNKTRWHMKEAIEQLNLELVSHLELLKNKF